MKKMICTRLLRLSAAALACAALSVGTPVASSFVQPEDCIQTEENQDDASDTGDNGGNGTEGKEEPASGKPGIQPLDNWDTEFVKH